MERHVLRPLVAVLCALASSIVPLGAVTRSGEEMRKRMGRKERGFAMEDVLADPDLTNEKLEVIRRYLVDVRDGAAPVKVEFAETAVGATSAPQTVTIANERTARDAPAVIASIKASGDFAIVPGGSCQAGGLSRAKPSARSMFSSHPRQRARAAASWSSSSRRLPGWCRKSA